MHDATTERMDTWPAHAHTPYIYDNCVGYGYQIWMCRPEGSYRADGAFGQFSVVVPSLDLIVSINEAGFLGELMGHSDLHLLKEGRITRSTGRRRRSTRCLTSSCRRFMPMWKRCPRARRPPC